MAFHIGTSGWSYDHWVGLLYPKRASSLERLDAYARRFRSVEVNNTFYRWPKDETFTTWHDRLPEGFVVSVKASRGLTQFRRLKDPKPWLDRMEGGLRRLGEKLGVLLVQLPRSLACDLGRLDGFLGLVPPGIRVAIEFRHPSWLCSEVFAVLERHGAAYCITSGASLPSVLRISAPFAYVRFHGPNPRQPYGGSYTDDDLRGWADRLREWAAQGREVFAYFNNDAQGNAVRNAETLQGMLGAGPRTT
ncbi:MAG: DUF72 domain-containing protein [Isosphaeraceae bacterium]|nr:DUF72 domain-containing protein [Isosphaeraceae bacterium]